MSYSTYEEATKPIASILTGYASAKLRLIIAKVSKEVKGQVDSGTFLGLFEKTLKDFSDSAELVKIGFSFHCQREFTDIYKAYVRTGKDNLDLFNPDSDKPLKPASEIKCSLVVHGLFGGPVTVNWTVGAINGKEGKIDYIFNANCSTVSFKDLEAVIEKIDGYNLATDLYFKREIEE